MVNMQLDHYLSRYITAMNSCTASLFSTFSLSTDNLALHMLRVSNMHLPNSRTARDLAILGAGFANIDISNRHVTLSQARREFQVPDKTEGSLLLPLKVRH